MTAPTPEDLAAIELRINGVAVYAADRADGSGPDFRDDLEALLAEVRRLMAQLRPLRQIIDLTAEARAGVDDHPQAERDAAPPVGQTVEQFARHLLRGLTCTADQRFYDDAAKDITARDAEVARAAAEAQLAACSRVMDDAVASANASPFWKKIDREILARLAQRVKEARAPAPAEKEG